MPYPPYMPMSPLPQPTSDPRMGLPSAQPQQTPNDPNRWMQLLQDPSILNLIGNIVSKGVAGGYGNIGFNQSMQNQWQNQRDTQKDQREAEREARIAKRQEDEAARSQRSSDLYEHQLTLQQKKMAQEYAENAAASGMNWEDLDPEYQKAVTKRQFMTYQRGAQKKIKDTELTDQSRQLGLDRDKLRYSEEQKSAVRKAVEGLVAADTSLDLPTTRAYKYLPAEYQQFLSEAEYNGIVAQQGQLREAKKLQVQGDQARLESTRALTRRRNAPPAANAKVDPDWDRAIADVKAKDKNWDLLTDEEFLEAVSAAYQLRKRIKGQTKQTGGGAAPAAPAESALDRLARKYGGQ